MTNTGPPYPRTGGGSSAIGQFVIGQSPIGVGATDAFDWWDTVLSQYANSPIMTGLLESFADAMNPSPLLDAFFDQVWNVDTAVGWGLDVWGRIVGVTRTLTVASGDYFGFKNSLGDRSGLGYNQAPFFLEAAQTDNFLLTDNAFRQLILAKALANISDGSSKSINALLLSLFPGIGNCYVVDNKDMTMTYQFDFTPTPVQRAILTQSGVLPTPTGVAASFVFPPV